MTTATETQNIVTGTINIDLSSQTKLFQNELSKIKDVLREELTNNLEKSAAAFNTALTGLKTDIQCNMHSMELSIKENNTLNAGSVAASFADRVSDLENLINDIDAKLSGVVEANNVFSNIQSSLDSLVEMVSLFSNESKELKEKALIVVDLNNNLMKTNESLRKLNDELIEEHKQVIHDLREENGSRDTSKFWLAVCIGFPWLIFIIFQFMYFRSVLAR